MNPQIERAVEKAVDGFKAIRGIDAIVLGGSYATDTATEESDVDICIYYDAGGFELQALQRKAAELDAEHRGGQICDTGAWGRWLDGGGWISIDGIVVDILFRSTQRLREVLYDCLNGNVSISYQSGYPFGFTNSIYIAELSICKILWQRGDTIEGLKQKLIPYPQKYKYSAIDGFLREAEFTLLCGRKAIVRRDIVYGSGALFRCASCLIQALYAINELFLINEKGSLKRLADSAGIWLPESFASDIEGCFSGLKPDELANAFETMKKYLQLINAYIRH